MKITVIPLHIDYWIFNFTVDNKEKYFIIKFSKTIKKILANGRNLIFNFHLVFIYVSYFSSYITLCILWYDNKMTTRSIFIIQFCCAFEDLISYKTNLKYRLLRNANVDQCMRYYSKCCKQYERHANNHILSVIDININLIPDKQNIRFDKWYTLYLLKSCDELLRF